MQGEKLESWQFLCALAAIEQDPEKLINRLLEEKEQRLAQQRKQQA
jgi:hypothetical protein